MKAPQPVARTDWSQLGFHFAETDTLYRSYGNANREPIWDDGEFVPFGPQSLSPAAAFFSYGLGIFEGLKAQRAADDRVLVFRAAANAERFARSAERLLMSPFPIERFVDAVHGVVRHNLRFVPPHAQGSFYLRPLQHAIEPKLGVRPGMSFWVVIFGCPVGEYFKGKGTEAGGLRLKVLEQGRVAAGGTGSAKAIGNYAGGIAIAHRWRQSGFDDVLYLDARHLRFLTETSASNVFVRLRSGVLVTPPLDDQILAGVTRDSALRIARDILGVPVEERALALEEVLADGREVFCTGTAWTVAPVRELEHAGRTYRFESSELQQGILRQILSIQQGKEPDPFGWVTAV
jgi:branched-chain amino acid aminotransferase